MLVSSVILNFGTPKLTLGCLESVLNQREHAAEQQIYVVDNCSPDTSAAILEAAIHDRGWASRVQLLALSSNYGFAGGNNAAIRESINRQPRPDYVLLLNSDVVLRENALKYLLEFMRDNPRAGIAGSRLESPDGTPQRSAFNFATPWSEFVTETRTQFIYDAFPKSVVAPPCPEGNRRVDWVPGACVIVRSSVFDSAGDLDDKYFMYYEDMDFCKAAAAVGWETWYVPQSRAMHLVGATSGVTAPAACTAARPAYYFDSRRRYFVKNFGTIGAAAADVCWLVGNLFYRLKMLLKGQPSQQPRGIVAGVVRHSVLYPGPR